MAEMVLPGVYIEVRPEALIVAGAVTVGNLGVVGTASKGPIGEIKILGSYPEAREEFGNYDPWIDGKSNELSLVRALQLAFRHGATTVFAVRATSTDNPSPGEDFIPAWNKNTKASKASFALASPSGTSTVLKAKNHGTWGNSVQVNVWDAAEDSFITDEKHDGPGSITLDRKPVIESARNRIRVYKEATGQTKIYELIYTGTPGPGQVLIDKNTGGLTFHTGPPDETPVAGDTLWASYAVAQSDSRQVTLRYGAVTEEYTIAGGKHLVADVGARSDLVVAEAGTAPTELPDKHASADDFHFFGRGANTPGSNGADASTADYERGLNQLLNELAHIIVAAGMEDEKIGDELKAHCETASTDKMKRDRIAVVGSKVGAKFDDIRGHTLDSDRVIFVAPGVKATDATSGEEVTLPGSYAAAAVAGMLSARDPHVSLTNKVLSVGGLETKFTQPQLAQLVQSRVLALEAKRLNTTESFRVVKAITSSANTAWHQITTRRIVDYAKYGVRSAAEPYIGLLNNDRVRKALKGSINGFLAGMVDDEMLISYVLDVTATREEQRRGIAKVTMTLQPTFSIDFIKVVMFLE